MSGPVVREDARPPREAPYSSPMRRLLPQRLTRVRTILGAVVVIVVGIVVWTVITALIARHDLNAARSDLAALEASPPDNLDQLRTDISRDRTLAASAASLTNQPGPWLFAHVPIVGRSVAAEHTIAAAASGLLTSLQPVVSDAAALSGGSAGGIDLTTLAKLHTDLARSVTANAQHLRALSGMQLSWTPHFVAGPAQQAASELRRAIVGLGTAGRAVGALRGILGADGPRTIMIALQNNAELRGTGGLVSSFALGTADNGRLKLGRFRDINSIAQQPGDVTRVPAPPTYRTAYGDFLANTTLWRNANMSADVPQSAEVMAELMQRSLHVRPDVIIFVDVPAMIQIIDGTGNTVKLPDGETVGGAALEHALLVQSYGKAVLNAAVEARRKAQLDAAAGRVFARVSSQPPSLGLLRSMASAASGGHITIWSAKPDEEAALSAAGISGQVAPGGTNLAMVVGQNLGDHPGFGNKLDYYVSRSLSVHAVVGRSVAAVTETLTMTNSVPNGLGPYIVGRAHPNQLRELIGMALPARATVDGFTSDGHSVPVQDVAADGTRELRTIVKLDQDESQQWTMRYTVPVDDGRFSFLGIPQPLAKPATLDVSLVPAAGLHLVGRGHTIVTDSRKFSRTGPWAGRVTIDVQASQPGFWGRLRQDLSDFWNHKVRI